MKTCPEKSRRRNDGFALHSSANFAKEMKGWLTAHSGGPGEGVTFILDLPTVSIP